MSRVALLSCLDRIISDHAFVRSVGLVFTAVLAAWAAATFALRNGIQLEAHRQLSQKRMELVLALQKLVWEHSQSKDVRSEVDLANEFVGLARDAQVLWPPPVGDRMLAFQNEFQRQWDRALGRSEEQQFADAMKKMRETLDQAIAYCRENRSASSATLGSIASFAGKSKGAGNHFA